jgi:hypothetical protein
MIKTEIGEMRSDSVKKVIEYFDHIAQRGTAKDIGVSGSFMSSLCKRGYMRVVDTEDHFICIDESRDLYRKVEVNIYAPAKPIKIMFADYCHSINKLADAEKEKANTMIECAKSRLTSAQSLISRIDFVNPSN